MVPKSLEYGWTPAILFLALAAGCSSDCAPTDTGGVLVDVSGINDCARLGVTASDSSEDIPLDSWPSSESEAGVVCSFRGLAGRAGTFMVNLSLDGQVVSSQSTTLERLDSCNVSSKLLTFDLS